MPTTTKMGIVYPASTDLVKDGATAMGTISTTVDNKTGLILLNTTNFSAVAAQPINDVFSANYDNYKIILDVVGSTTLSLNMRLRVSGADNSTSNYAYQYVSGSNTAISGARATGQTAWVLNGGQNTDRSTFSIDIVSPFLNQVTAASYLSSLYYSTAVNLLIGMQGMSFIGTTSFTGYSLIASTGSITGTVKTYGYNQ